MMENDTGDKKEAADHSKLDASASADVAFLYKTMLQRDPSKRRVKPVEQHLMQIHFGMSDDDDTDSDYEFKPGAGSDDDIGSDEFDGVVSDDEGKSTNKSKDGTAREADSEDSDSADDDDEIRLSEVESVSRDKDTVPVLAIAKVFSKACCVCLSSTGHQDEIIECDGCGILVHEDCYGTVEEDALSIHSNMSTESTEPWFCDPCKAGVVPSCELCPNQFGIFKQTDTARWVHLICALYVPAVAFGNTEKLTNVTLLEMPYSKWGSKECSLCEDENYCYTGVCIGCDAGMCRSYFHVTCAQKQGLLSEASIDEEIADPFYAHCRMHGDKLVSKQKKRNFLALYSHVKQFRATKGNRPVSQRTKGRLEHFKRKFQEAEARRPPAWVPPNKLPRAISSSSYAVSSLLRKAELLGIISGPKATVQKSELVTKKSYVAPALTVEFASYHAQRTAKIDSLKKLNEESIKQNTALQSQERKLEFHMEKLRMMIRELQKSREEHRETFHDMFASLEAVTEGKISIPEKYKQHEKLVSPTLMVSAKGHGSNGPCGICDSAKEQHLLAKCDQCFKFYHLYCLDPPLTRMPKKSKLCGWVCSICDHQNHQVPAKIEEGIDTDAPRRLRQSIKEPDKFIQPELKLFVERSRRNRYGKARKRPSAGAKRPVGAPRIPVGLKRKRPKPAPAKPAPAKPAPDVLLVEPIDPPQDPAPEPAQIEDPVMESAEEENAPRMGDAESSASQSTLSPAKVGRRSKVLETGTCKPCNAECNGGNAVRCDDCSSWHHFACLDPPVKKSPKPRGYQWFCDDCERHEEAITSSPINADCPGEISESLTMEIVQGDDPSQAKVVSFDGSVTAL